MRERERVGWSVNLGKLVGYKSLREGDRAYFLVNASMIVSCFSCVSLTPR